jgi:hypothetical protein
VTREGNKYNDIHLSLLFFSLFRDSSRLALLSKREKEFPIPSNPFFYFYFTFFFFFLSNLSIFFSGSSQDTHRHIPVGIHQRLERTAKWTQNEKNISKKLDVENVKNVLDGRYFGNAKSKADGGNEDSPSHLNLL